MFISSASAFINLLLVGLLLMPWTPGYAQRDPFSIAGATSNPNLAATLSIQPVSVIVHPGDSFTVGVYISNAVNLGAFEASIQVTPSIVRIDNVTQGDFLGSTGRPVSPVTPQIDPVQGTANFGAFTLGSTPPGPDGAGTLAVIHLTALAGGQSSIHFSSAQISDATGATQPTTLVDGQVEVACVHAWTGAISSDWFTPGNWGCRVPGASDTEMIPAGTPHDPILTGNAAVGGLTIAVGASMTLNGGSLTVGPLTINGTLTTVNAESINISGDWHNNGTFVPGQGKVIFNGGGNQEASTYVLPITYTRAENPPLAIPDGACPVYIDSTLLVSANATIRDVDVTINIAHTYDEDLNIYLVSPANTQVELSTGNGGRNDNYTNTRFDDEATTAITAGAAPFTGSFRPEGQLSSLDGQNTAGAWKLRVCDSERGDVGTILSWSLDMNAPASPADVVFHDLVVGSIGANTVPAAYAPAFTASVTFASNLVAENVTVQPEAQLNLGANTMTVAGTLVNNGQIISSPPSQTAVGVGTTLRFNGPEGQTNVELIDAPVGLGSIAVQVVKSNSVPAGVFGTSCPLVTNALRRFYNITPSGTGVATMRLYYDPTVAELNGNNEADLHFWHCAGNGWEILTGTVTHGAVGSWKYVEMTGIGAFSPFMVRDTRPLAAALVDLRAIGMQEHISIQWETVSELDNLGFNILRSTSPTGPAEQLNATLIPSQAPGSSQGFTYTWDDFDVVNGTTYYYWLQQINLAGVATLHGPVSAMVSAPTAVTASTFDATSQSGKLMLATLLCVVGIMVMLIVRRRPAQ